MRFVYAFVTIAVAAVSGCGPSAGVPPARDLSAHEIPDGDHLSFDEDLSLGDLAALDGGKLDLSSSRDLHLPADLTPIADLGLVLDLTTPPDLLPPRDLTPPPDLATNDCSPMVPDGTCVNANQRCYAGACTGPCAAGLNGWCANATDTCDATAGSCKPATQPGTAEALVSEVLIDAPTVGAVGEAGEYVEFFNATTKVINLKGCYLRSESGTSTENAGAFGDIPIAPLHLALLRRSIAGVVFDYTPAATYDTLSFANGAADWVALHCGAVVVDAIGWQGNMMYPNLASVTADTAWERSRASLLTGGAANPSTVWCKSTQTRIATPSGTPGVPYLGSPGQPNTCP
jgi:hypothetical protein